MNIEKYIKRIGIKEKLEPTIESLFKLQTAHLYSIPFENLDIHIGTKIELDISKLFEKIITNGRGGFCYELNGLFYELLTSLDFNARMISAKVYSREKGYGKEFDHLALLVKIDQDEYLADVGFGEFTMQPLKFELNTHQKDKNGIFVIDKYDDKTFRVNKIEGDKVRPQYIFKETRRSLDDFINMCIFHQTSKESHFTKNKIITLPTENGRITLTSDKLKIRSKEYTNEVLVKDENQFHKYLKQYFKINL